MEKSKAFLLGFYAFWQGVHENPYYTGGNNKSKAYWDWDAGYESAKKAAKDC